MLFRMKSFFQKLAKLAVKYSVGIKKDQRVFVLGPTLAEELFQALYVEIQKLVLTPYFFLQSKGILSYFLNTVQKNNYCI